MKITLDQLTRSVAKESRPIYFISSDETLLLQEAALLIRQSAYDQGFTDRECITVEKGFAWQSFLTATKNLSLFGEKKLIELRLASVKLDATQAMLLHSYCLSPSSDKVLLITAPKLEIGWQKIKWVQTIIEQNVFLQIWPIENRELPRWIMERFRKLGFCADLEAAKILAERFEGNLLALAQEIEKLKLLFGAKKITLEDVLAVAANNIHADLFTLVDYALQGNLKKTIFMLDNLKSEGTEPILVLWILVRELRLLLGIVAEQKSNQSVDLVLKTKRVMAKRIPMIKKALTRHSASTFAALLQHGGRIDKILKGMISGDVWRELTELTLHLAGTSLFAKIEDFPRA